MTKEAAIAMVKSGWWRKATPEQIVGFQLFEDRLCMDFHAFHEAVEKCLGRPVFTHEFGLAHVALQQEFLGRLPKPSFQEIMDLIPAEKRIIVLAGAAKEGGNG